MAVITAFPVATYPSGAHAIAATSLSDSITSIGIAVQRCTTADPTIWPNTSDSISFDLQVSLDNGVTYQEWASGSDTGGIRTTKFGETLTMDIQGSLPAGTNRWLKGTATITVL